MAMRKVFPMVLTGCLAAGVVFLSGCQNGSPSGAGSTFKGPVGLQLYSLREQFKKDVPGTLDEVKSFGIKYAELAGTYDMPPEKFKAELAQRGIEPISGHFPYEKYRDDVESIAKEAEALGLKYAGCAWIPHEGR